MNQLWRIELFGWLRAVPDTRAADGDRVVSRFRTRRAGSLLAYLAFYLRRPHPREQLMELLWPECPPAAARDNLSRALSSLRHQLEPPGVAAGAVLVADRASVQLNPAVCRTDVAEFEEACAAAERAEAAIAGALGVPAPNAASRAQHR